LRYNQNGWQVRVCQGISSQKYLIIVMMKKHLKYMLYTRQNSQDLVAAFGFILFFIGGQRFWSGEVYIISLILYFLAGAVVFSVVKDVRKLYIVDDTLYVENLLSTNSFHARMIDKVEEILVPIGSNRTYQRLIPALSIKIKNGKTIQITPLGEIDIEKILLNWRDKYQASQ
jgi:hypothetical protein